MALRAEKAHEEGRKGVFLTQRWLESTTHLDLPFNAYDLTSPCTVTCLDGSLQTFDLSGFFYAPKRQVFVENKSYSTVGKQPVDYMDFLAIAYSATAQEIVRLKDDPGWEFMWVTTHPFSQSDWSQLTTRKRMKTALDADKTGLLNGSAIDEDLLTTVSSRIWLLVLNKRQERIALTPSELLQVLGVLKRKNGGQ